MLVDAVLLIALLAVAGALVLSLVRGALRHWHAQRAGTAYELPADYRPAVRRGAGAAAVAVLTVVAAVSVLSTPEPVETFTSAPKGMPGPSSGTGPGHRQADGGRAPAQGAPPRPSASPARSRPGPPASTAPSPSVSVPSESPYVPRTAGHPAGGTLHRLSGGKTVDVWLPAAYHRPSGARVAFPVVLAHVPEGGAAGDLFTAFAEESRRGFAHPFIVVVARGCGEDARAFLKVVDQRYRTLRDARGRAVLGLGADSSCAVTTALNEPDRYRSAAALATSHASGDVEHARLRAVRTPDTPRIADASPGAHRNARNARNARDARNARPRLLLASTSTDLPARAAAVRLRSALAPFADTRIVDTVEPSGERRNLFRVAARYLTEQLSAPART